MCASAGASVARDTLQSKRQYTKIDSVDDISYRPDFLMLLYGGFENLSISEAATMPITFAAFAEDDPCIPAAMGHTFNESMCAGATKPFIIKDYPDGGHGWASCSYYPELTGKEVCKWRLSAQKFL